MSLDLTNKEFDKEFRDFYYKRDKLDFEEGKYSRLWVFQYFKEFWNKENLECIIDHYEYLVSHVYEGKSLLEKLVLDGGINYSRYPMYCAIGFISDFKSDENLFAWDNCIRYTNDDEYFGLLPFCYFEGYLDLYERLIKVVRFAIEDAKHYDFIDNYNRYLLVPNEKIFNEFISKYTVENYKYIKHNYINPKNFEKPKTLFQLALLAVEKNVCGENNKKIEKKFKEYDIDIRSANNEKIIFDILRKGNK